MAFVNEKISRLTVDSTTMNNASQWIGRTIGGICVIEQLLGCGGMSAVFQARHLRTGGKLAVKLTTSLSGMRESYHARLLQEARIISRLSHPHIVHVYDVGEDQDGNPYLIMELLNGEDFDSFITRNGHLSIEDTLKMAQQVGSGLHTAHKNGIIHRDIKPQNIFVTHSSIAGRLERYYKILDFGISRAIDSPMGTTDGTILGTPCYISPEAVQGQPVDARADQYALAVMIFYALSGRLLFESNESIACMFKTVHEVPPRLQSVCPHVPGNIDDAVHRALSKNKEERFEDIEQFITTLTSPNVKGTPNATLAVTSHFNRPHRIALLGGLSGALGMFTVSWLVSSSTAIPSSDLTPRSQPAPGLQRSSLPPSLTRGASEVSQARSSLSVESPMVNKNAQARPAEGHGPQQRQVPRHIAPQRPRPTEPTPRNSPTQRIATDVTVSDLVPKPKYNNK